MTTATKLDTLVEAFVQDLPWNTTEETPRHDPDKKARRDGNTAHTLTDTAKRLRQDNLRRQLDDLTRPCPILRGDHGQKPRRKQILGEQKKEGRLLEGNIIAERRGLGLLVREYQNVLLRRFKEHSRTRLVLSGSLPTTGEDVDLEQRYEAMPLSPLFLKAAEGKTYSELHATSPGGKQFRVQVLSLLKNLAKRVTEACIQGLTSHENLSAHEEVLGAVYLHLDASGALNAAATTSKRLRKKTSGTQDESAEANLEMFQILLVLAFGAWVEQTERWFRMPENPN